MLTGAGCIVGAIWYAVELPKVKAVVGPIYEKMGIPAAS